jgi:putative phage-type endonuclease
VSRPPAPRPHAEQIVIGEHAAIAVPVDPALAVVEPYATEVEWLAARRRYITASEIAAVLGLSRYASPMGVWLDKLGLAEPTAELERMRWGKRLQRPIAAGFADDTGRHVLDPGPYTLLRSVRYPWLAATPDYFTARPDVPTPGVLDVKNASAYTKRDWLDEPPVPYQLQVQGQLLVTGLDWGTLVALIGGAELVYADLTVHGDAVDVILTETERLWQCVQRETPPPALDGSAATTAAIRRLFATTDAGPVVELPPDAAGWDALIAEGEHAIERLTEQVNAAKNHLRVAIGHFESGRLPDGGVWSNKLVRRKGYVVEPSETRQLRRSRREEGGQ